MEITAVEPILLSYRLSEDEQWKLGGGFKQPPTRGVKADLALVRVHTDEGVTGLGEPTPYAGAAHVRDAVERYPYDDGPVQVDWDDHPF